MCGVPKHTSLEVLNFPDLTKNYTVPPRELCCSHPGFPDENKLILHGSPVHEFTAVFTDGWADDTKYFNTVKSRRCEQLSQAMFLEEVEDSAAIPVGVNVDRAYAGAG